MYRKKLLVILMCTTLAFSATMAACGTTTTTESETESSNTVVFSDDSYSETSFSGTVTAVDGNTITLSIMDGMGGGAGGEAPSDAGEAPDGAGEDMDSTEMGEAPDGAGEEMDSTEMGEVPSGDGESASSVTATLTINDESIITDSEGNTATLESISEGDMLTVEVDEDGNVTSIVIGGSMEGGAPEGSASSGVDSYDAVVEYTEDTEVSGETYTSTGTDENAVHAYNGAAVTLEDITVDRTSDDSTGGDNSSFYGVGAALLETDGTLYVNGATITTDSAGAAGAFAYGDGIVYIADATITTQQDTSGGIHAAGGGTLYAWDLTVETNGESSAAIRSDRGGGTMVVDGGTYTANGVGSPAVYCTADIAINDATLTATGSEAVCLEGLNTLNLYDVDLTGNMSDDDQNDCTWTVILYQSMSGDSEVGVGTFNMTGGSLTSENGGLFYTTNTESVFYLSDVDITASDDCEFFLRVTGNDNERGWGTSGDNGAQCTFTADDQEMEGDVIWDSISTLDFYMENGSSLTGAFVNDESCAGNGGDGYANLYISDDSTWVVTGDSTLTNLYNEGTIVDEDGNTVTIVGTDGTVYVEGDSDYTITVDNYETSADFSGATTGGSFSDYEVENPFES